MRRPTRRTVLIAGAATTAAAAGVWAVWPPDPGELACDAGLPEHERWSALEAHLRGRFWFLDIPDETMGQFLAAAREHGGLPRSTSKLDDVRKTFLLSTDFFLKDGDESRPLRWVAWYDPYVTPCWNPMVRRGEG